MLAAHREHGVLGNVGFVEIWVLLSGINDSKRLI